MCVRFDDEVTLHEEEDGVDFSMEVVGGDIGFEEDEEDGLINEDFGGVHLIEEGEH